MKAVAKLLDDEGGKEYAEEISKIETQKALAYLGNANPQGEGGDALRQLAYKLLDRKQ
ncbi:MAG: hypothetical protein IPJ46_06285 [Anaerolineales bacterium]|nr:hypothetical protein [Anaerolineales bacterium]